MGICKKCEQEYRRRYLPKLGKMYSSQKLSSKRRGHPEPNYTKEEFIIWAEQNGYALLHAAWIHNQYARCTAPSADRLDDTKSYSLSNLQLGTWGENDDKGHADFKSGKLFNNHTAVQQFDKTGKLINTFHSQNAAARTVPHTTQGNIGMVCRGIRKTSGGFIWGFLNAGSNA